jgi:hemolysin activation/secretion protein
VTKHKTSPAKPLRRFNAALLCFASIGAYTVFSTATQAAPPSTQSLPGAVQPGRDRPVPPPPAPSSDYDFSIQAPHRSAVPRAADEIHFKLTDIRIVGAVTLSANSFRPLYQDLLGKDVTLTNIYDIADAIERAYRTAGYPLVRAYVPPQRVKDGVFTINVVEGFVSAVSVEGTDAKTAAQIKGYLQNVEAEKPLQLGTIERGLLLSNDLPGVSATGVLRPAPDTPGASDLIVTAEQPKFSGGLAADNRGSRFSGIWTISGDAEVNSLLFGGDQLMLDGTISPDSLEQAGGDVHYRTPIGNDGLMGTLFGRYTHGEPGSTLQAFNVLTDSYAFGPRLSYPLVRTREQTVSLDGGLTIQDAIVNFGTPSVKLSHDKWRVFDADVNWLDNDLLGGSLGASADLAKGLDILDATPDNSPALSRVGGTTDFTKITLNARYTHPLPDDFSFAFQLQSQLSFDRLITGEQIAFGGSMIGRGYDPGAITGDDGIGASTELRYTTRIGDSFLQMVQPFVFFDTAGTWYRDSIGLPHQSIDSTGIGIRGWFDDNITGDIEVDRTLRAVPGSDAGKEATKVLVDLAIRF